LGVLTKLDLLEDQQQLEELFNNEVYPLELGYYGLKCRNQKELDAGISIQDALNLESKFFAGAGNVFAKFGNKMGTRQMCGMLSSYLSEQIKRCLPQVRTKLQQMIQEKEKDVKGIGQTLQTSNDPTSKAALLISLLNKYNKFFTATLNGESFIENDLCGGAKINYILDNVYKRQIYSLDPYASMKDEDVMTQIRNICGLNTSLIISDKAFEVLVKKQIEMFKQPTYECLNMVFQEMKKITCKVAVPEFEVFTRLGKAIADVMDEILKRCLGPTENMIEQLFKIEKGTFKKKNNSLGYINTKHPDFVHQREYILAHKSFSQRPGSEGQILSQQPPSNQ
jgi:dynamin 1-like protein